MLLGAGAWWWSTQTALPSSMRNLPVVSDNEEGQAAFARVVQAIYDGDKRRVMREVGLARAAGSDAPIVDYLEMSARNNLSAQGSIAGRLAEIRSAVEGRADPVATLNRVTVGWGTVKQPTKAELHKQLTNLDAQIGHSYLLRYLLAANLRQIAPEACLSRIERLIDEDSGPLALHEIRIALLIDARRLDEALAAVETLKERGVDRQSLNISMAMTLHGLGRSAEAVQAFEDVLKRDTTAWGAHSGLIEIATDSGDNVALNRHLDVLLSDIPPRLVAVSALGAHIWRLAGRGRAGEVVSVAERFVAQGKPQDDAAAQIAMTALWSATQVGPPAALLRLRPKVKRASESPGLAPYLTTQISTTLLVTDMILARRGAIDAQQAVMERLKAAVAAGLLDSNSGLTVRSRVALMAGDKESALRHLQAASKNPGKGSASLYGRFIMAELRSELGQREQAVSELRAIVKEGPACKGEFANFAQLCRAAVARAMSELHLDALKRGKADEAKAHAKALKAWWPQADADVMAWLLRRPSTP